MTLIPLMTLIAKRLIIAITRILEKPRLPETRSGYRACFQTHPRGVYQYTRHIRGRGHKGSHTRRKTRREKHQFEKEKKKKGKEIDMAQHVGVDSDRIPFFEVFNVKKTLKLFDAFAFNFKCIIPMRYL